MLTYAMLCKAQKKETMCVRAHIGAPFSFACRKQAGDKAACCGDGVTGKRQAQITTQVKGKEWKQ